MICWRTTSKKLNFVIKQQCEKIANINASALSKNGGTVSAILIFGYFKTKNTICADDTRS